MSPKEHRDNINALFIVDAFEFIRCQSLERVTCSGSDSRISTFRQGQQIGNRWTRIRAELKKTRKRLSSYLRGGPCGT